MDREERRSPGARALDLTIGPFKRMWASDRPLDAFALVHMSSVAGDAMVAIALADSVFFSIPVGQAKIKVALYLALAMAPLAVAGPLLVPLLDRGRFRRTISFVSGGGRALCAFIAAPRFGTVLLFPLAFVLLVLSRIHAITKNGLTTAYAGSGEALVRANARLGRLAAVAAGLGAVPGLIALKLGGSQSVLYVATLVYATSALLNLRLPRADTPRPARLPGEVGPRGRLPDLATPAAATAGLRAASGFLMFLLAFALRGQDQPAYWFGVLMAAGLAGTFLGDVVAPHLATGLRDQAVVLGALFAAGLAAFMAFAEFGLPLLTVFALMAGASTEFGRLAFQSLMQSQAPGGAQGRVFVRYEAMFQLAWVGGAFLPAIFPIPFRAGILILAVWYVILGVAFLVWPRASARHERSDR